MWQVEAVGPMGLAADQVVGRPSQGANCPQLRGVGLVWALSCPNTEAWPVLDRFALVLGLHLVELILNLCSGIFCDFLSGQSVLANCILSQNHLHKFSNTICGIH